MNDSKPYVEAELDQDEIEKSRIILEQLERRFFKFYTILAAVASAVTISFGVIWVNLPGQVEKAIEDRLPDLVDKAADRLIPPLLEDAVEKKTARMNQRLETEIEQVRKDVRGLAKHQLSEWLVRLGGNARFEDGKMVAVDLVDSEVSGQELRELLKELSQLETIINLKLQRTGTSDEEVPLLIDFDKLENLDVRQTQLSSDGIRNLNVALPDTQVLSEF